MNKKTTIKYILTVLGLSFITICVIFITALTALPDGAGSLEFEPPRKEINNNAEALLESYEELSGKDNPDINAVQEIMGSYSNQNRSGRTTWSYNVTDNQTINVLFTDRDIVDQIYTSNMEGGLENTPDVFYEISKASQTGNINSYDDLENILPETPPDRVNFTGDLPKYSYVFHDDESNELTVNVEDGGEIYNFDLIAEDTENLDMHIADIEDYISRTKDLSFEELTQDIGLWQNIIFSKDEQIRHEYRGMATEEGGVRLIIYTDKETEEITSTELFMQTLEVDMTFEQVEETVYQLAEDVLEGDQGEPASFYIDRLPQNKMMTRKSDTIEYGYEVVNGDEEQLRINMEQDVTTDELISITINNEANNNNSDITAELVESTTDGDQALTELGLRNASRISLRLNEDKLVIDFENRQADESLLLHGTISE